MASDRRNPRIADIAARIAPLLPGNFNSALEGENSAKPRDVADPAKYLGKAMAALHQSGVLAPSDLLDADRLLALLLTVAEANLPLARLVEGHANALLLIDAHGTPAQKVDVTNAASSGEILGVWGADGADPLRADGDKLAGGKRFASGLGTVSRAVVTLAADNGIHLALIDVSDPARHRPETWRMHGMQATASGDIDLTGLAADWLGAPGAYFTEPSFVGGVWRIAAVQLGGTFGLLRAARDRLQKLGRLEADAQIGRLSPLLARAIAAFGLVERAAATASGPQGANDPDLAVALSIKARLLTEDLAQDTIAAVERSVGLEHFADGTATGRIARDLATYCRQAARDAMEQRAGRILLVRPGPLSDLCRG